MRLALPLLCLVLAAPAARAVPVTFTWEGTAISFFETGTSINAEMGDPVSGSFTFESETPLTSTGYRGAILDWKVEFGPHTLVIDDPPGAHDIVIEDGPPGRDLFLAAVDVGPGAAQLDGALLDGHHVTSVLTLEDPQGLMLAGTALPLEAPPRPFGLMLLNPHGADGTGFNLQAIVDEIVASNAVPEPGAWLLFAVSLVALQVSWRRPWRRAILPGRGVSP